MASAPERNAIACGFRPGSTWGARGPDNLVLPFGSTHSTPGVGVESCPQVRTVGCSWCLVIQAGPKCVGMHTVISVCRRQLLYISHVWHQRLLGQELNGQKQKPPCHGKLLLSRLIRPGPGVNYISLLASTDSCSLPLFGFWERLSHLGQQCAFPWTLLSWVLRWLNLVEWEITFESYI